MEAPLFLRPLCLGVALFSGSVHAGPADYVYMPTVDYGEKEIDFKFGAAEQPSGESAQVASLGIGYGATDWWFTEVYIKTEHERPEPRLNILELENKFQLTETGKYPLEVGLIAEFELPLNNDGEPYEFKFGPLFQTEFDKLQLNGNLLLETKFGDGNPTETGFQYQWQTKYRWRKEFEFGLQGFRETGEWDNWLPSDEQEHKLGPAAFGKVQVGDHAAIKYNAAWLIGMTNATPDNTLRMQVEYGLLGQVISGWKAPRQLIAMSWLWKPLMEAPLVVGTLTLMCGSFGLRLAVHVVGHFGIAVQVVEAAPELRRQPSVVTDYHPRRLDQPDSIASFSPKSLTIQPNSASSLLFLPNGVKGVAEKS